MGAWCKEIKASSFQTNNDCQPWRLQDLKNNRTEQICCKSLCIMICCKFNCLSNVKFIDGEENCPHWSDDIKNWPEIWPDWYGRASNRSKLPTNSCTDLCQSLFTANINWPVWRCVKPGDKLLHGSVSIAFQCKHYSVRLRLCQTAKRFILITFNVWGCVKPNDKLSNRFVSTTFQCTHIWSLVSPFADMSNPVTKQRTDLC